MLNLNSYRNLSHIYNGQDLWDKKNFDNLYRKYKKTKDESIANILITANIPYVIKIAKRFFDPDSFLEFNDLVHAGICGLITSFYKYDLKKGIKFINYAVWEIKREIIEEIRTNSQGGVRLPQHAKAPGFVFEADQEAINSGVPSPNYSDFYEDIENKDMTNRIIDYVKPKLKFGDLEFIALRFGQDGEGEKSFEELGTLYYKTTRQAVEEKEKRILKVLRSSLSSNP